MIPYFQLNSFPLGPITIQVWGAMVALGIIMAVLLMRRLGRQILLAEPVILDLSLWVLIVGFSGARFFHVIFYEPAYYLANPFEILAVWHGGLSSLGGLAGAFAAGFIFFKRRGFNWRQAAPYLDVFALGIWLGWAIGRLGCFLIHDHPGTLSHFILAVKFPSGARHDLGLYDSLLALVLFCLGWLIFRRRKCRAGLVAALTGLGYALVRFFLDFLRARDLPGSDIRYSGLTPAQWGMATLVLALTFLLIYGRMRRKSRAVDKVGPGSV